MIFSHQTLYNTINSITYNITGSKNAKCTYGDAESNDETISINVVLCVVM